MEKYENIEVIGRGASGTVHLCRRLADEKLVIIKQIPVEQLTTEDRISTMNEVKILRMLNHPNIIQYYESFLAKQALMIVMEYAKGGTLDDYLRKRDGNLLDESEILHFFVQMLLSLQHVHSKAILHRDLKTQNILLDHTKTCIKIGDFGISKILSSKSEADSVVGTPCYISPELCEGKPYNQKSDIWALGCVLYELASLKRAFEAHTLPALILKIMKGRFEQISSTYSEALRQLILSLLHLDPAKRPSINEILAQPILLNIHTSLYTDMGRIPCTSKNYLVMNRGQHRMFNKMQNHKGGVLPQESVEKDFLTTYQTTRRHTTDVYIWGGGILLPEKLHLPVQDARIRDVSIGRMQKAAITEDGKMLIWESSGDNMDVSSLSTHTPGSSPILHIPRFIERQSAINIQQVSCGDLFTAFLTDRGLLMTFGSGANGCLGHGDYSDVHQATIVQKLVGHEVTQVSCGASHVIAVTNQHQVYAWGRGDNGRLGLGTQDNHLVPTQVQLAHTARGQLDNSGSPSLNPSSSTDATGAEEGVGGGGGGGTDNVVGKEVGIDQAVYTVCSVRCGIDCSMLLTTQGSLLCTGNNKYNKLGLDNEDHHIDEVLHFTAVQTPPLSQLSVAHVALGTSHSAIITDKGRCYTFGANHFGQLGCSTKISDRRPSSPAELNHVQLKYISCGDTFTIAVTQDNCVYSWGKSARGRLGRVEENCYLPTLVPMNFSHPNSVIISLSSSHVATLLAVRSPQVT